MVKVLYADEVTEHVHHTPDTIADNSCFSAWIRLQQYLLLDGSQSLKSTL